MSSPSGERRHLNAVSNAIGRFGFPDLVPELKRLLDEDLVRLKRTLDGYSEARRHRQMHAMIDASRYGFQYQHAFSQIGGDEVAAIAATYLEDRVFGFDEAPEAYAWLEAGKHFGKVVIRVAL